jgi:hypothetical protein
MCRTYNTIGSLTTLKRSLEKNNVYDFKSVKEVIEFQKSFSTSRQELISIHETLIENEKNNLTIILPILKSKIETQREQTTHQLTQNIDLLKKKLNNLDHKISTNYYQKITILLMKWHYKRKIKHKESDFEKDIEMSLAKILEDYQFKSDRLQFISSNFNEAVSESAQNPLSELERKKAVIDSLNNYIYGALGEQKVVKTLECLSDDYYLINDFAVTFSKAIYYKQENDYIKSVQIDHILVAPSGIFLIETKNWSEKSIKNMSLRSPVEQIKRANYALYHLLNSDKSNYRLRLEKHHWGDKKTPIKNLIVLTKTKPIEEFQYVKILTTNELINYLNYFKPIFSSSETKKIAEFILQLNG